MNIDELEKGHIYFFYRPKVQEKASDIPPQHINDIQRFYIVLHPYAKKIYRLLVLGQKHLPIAEQHQRLWSTIDLVTDNQDELLEALQGQTYQTKTRGKRYQPEVRACGEGTYAIIYKAKQTYLVYLLELPAHMDEVQKQFKLEPEASYVLSVKNQAIAGIQGSHPADYPKHLKDLFKDLRFIPVSKPELLDYPGAELLMIGASKKAIGEKGTTIEKKDEDLDTADIFKDLRLWRNEHTVIPLLSGEWR